MRILSKFTVLGLMLMSLVSCDNDDDDPKVSEGGDVLISTILVNPDGFSGSAYMQIIEDLSPAEYSNEIAYQIGGICAPPIQIGNDVYALPGVSNATNKLEKYTWVNGKLEWKGEYDLPAASGAVHCVIKGDKAYISLHDLGKILIINPQTLTKIDELDISDYGVGDNNPDPSVMLIRDNLLYVPLCQRVGMVSDPNRPKVDVLIIDTETDQAVKMITDSTSGMSFPTKHDADYNSIFMDENNDIYINCLSGFGFLGQKAGLLRIKSGATDFDESYSFDVTNTAVDGFEYSPAYLLNVRYAGNGKLYATATISELNSTPEPNWLEDRATICLEVDMQAQTLKKLDLPLSNWYGNSVGLYNDEVVFGLVTNKDAGFYTYNSTTAEASASATIKVSGFPFWFQHLGEKY